MLLAKDVATTLLPAKGGLFLLANEEARDGDAEGNNEDDLHESLDNAHALIPPFSRKPVGRAAPEGESGGISFSKFSSLLTITLKKRKSDHKKYIFLKNPWLRFPSE